jgi:hypothetical protein
MLKRNHFVIYLVFLLMFTFACSSSEKDEAKVFSTSDYADLVSLYKDFREFVKPNVNNGVPDYSAESMDAQKRGLKQFQDRFAAINISGWPVAQQIDYHVVRAEINGVDFDHRITHPWTRDPGFYHIWHATKMHGWPMQNPQLPLSADEVGELQIRLQAIPEIYKQAKVNLTEGSEELAIIAIRIIKRREIPRMRNLTNQLAEHHPDLVPDAEKAIVALEDFRDWLEENKSNMTAPVGIGKDNYNWWLKNVQLIPYTWDECLAIVEREYERAITFLKLEEKRNQELPEFVLTASEEEHQRRYNEAKQYLMKFLREKEIVTIPDGIEPRPAGRWRGIPESGFRDFFQQCNDRDPLLYQVAHNFFGHLYVHDTIIWYQDGDSRPIRGVGRLFDIHEARSEGFNFFIEEMLVNAGMYDNRQRARELCYIWIAFRTSRAIADLKMHSGEYTLMDGIQRCVEMLPYPWADLDSDAVWWDIENTLRQVGHITFYVVGKSQIMQLFAEQSIQLGEEFNLRQFMDDFMGGGIIPISLTRWETTGFEDQIKKLW